MAAINFLPRRLRPQRQAHKRPNIINHLILRMSLGIFASMLPLLLFRFIVSFGLLFSESLHIPTWQLNWGEAISGAFVLALMISIMIAMIIQVVTLTPKLFKHYGRFAGRFCTVMITGLSVIFPYMVLMFASDKLVAPMFIVACFVPVINFIVVSSATKYYLLRLRIYYDLTA